MRHGLPLPAALLLVPLLFAACSGPGMATPTPIPADIVRPAQPTPQFSTAQPQFRLEPVTAEPVFVATEEASRLLTPPAPSSDRSLLRRFLMNQPPSALGIAPGGTVLYDEPGGSVVAAVPAAGSVTVTGRSADGAWLAAFDRTSIAGWVPAGDLVLFGDDDLTVVTTAFSPAPVATMLAEAMQPQGTPIQAALTAIARTPVPAIGTPPPPAAAGETALLEGEPVVGSVTSTGNLNLRDQPSTDGAVIASLPSGASVVVLGRSDDGAWLRVRTPRGDGWLSAQYVSLTP